MVHMFLVSAIPTPLKSRLLLLDLISFVHPHNIETVWQNMLASKICCTIEKLMGGGVFT